MINGHKTLKNWWIQMRNNVFASASTALNGAYLHITYCLYHVCEILISMFPLLRTNYSITYIVCLENVPCSMFHVSSIADINSWKVIFRSKRFLNINLKPPRIYQFQIASINFIAHICTYIVHGTRQLRSSIWEGSTCSS